MTTELDRLLELEQQNIYYDGAITEKEHEERKSLKSQIESKLELMDSYKKLTDDYQRELSQLRPIVQALRKRTSEYQYETSSQGGTHTTNPNQNREAILQELESILASNEVKQ